MALPLSSLSGPPSLSEPPRPAARRPPGTHRPAWLWRALLGAALLGPGASPVAGAQAVCDSGGQPAPRQLRERFLSADCAECWRRPGAALAPGQVAVDWIVPAAGGDEAPLAAAALADALQRLPVWGLKTADLQPPGTAGDGGALIERDHPRARPAGRLRLAQGPALNDYLGTGVDWRPRRALAGASLWLLLVEALPAGTEGSPGARLLVRNSMNLDLPATARHWREQRPLRIPEGARPERLQLLGWVQDSQGRMLTISESVCKTGPESGPGR